jgi:hypothetical protein
MKKRYFISAFTLGLFQLTAFAQSAITIYQSPAFTITNQQVVQGKYTATALSATELSSNYRSPKADSYSPTITFKFSINSRDNEMPAGKNHVITLQPINGKCVTDLEFGKQLMQTNGAVEKTNLPENTIWTIRLDMRKVLGTIEKNGFYTLFNGDKITKLDIKGIYLAGNAAPISWDFSNLYQKPDMQLQDPDGDGIYELTVTLNSKKDIKKTNSNWKLTKDISSFPQYKSDYPISDAIYNLAIEEMMNAVEPDSTFRTGKEWAGVWTRDISYSIILSMAHLQPKVAKYSLLRKVKNGRIIQDTGTGGAYPVSTDRIIWALAAWELYKTTGNDEWLKQAYEIVKNSIEDDLKNVYDPLTAMVKGESSFLDWREQTYPRWMQPTDIYESENLGTNAVHYQANVILSKMATLLNDKQTAEKHILIAEKIKAGINKYLWQPDKGYYAQYLYGRNYKTVSPRAEALGEALCVWFGIADAAKTASIVSNVPVMDYGISCIYPQIPGIPPYHNDAVWPFVQTYWSLASTKAGNEKSVMECIAAVYRPAALFLTNKENFAASTGDFAETQINSSNMLWSLSGSLAVVQKVLFGIEFGTDSLNFHPFVPEALAGKRLLTNFKCRNAVLDIDMNGFGNEIKSFELDGQLLKVAAVPYSLTGKHSVKIALKNTKFPASTINKVPGYVTDETPAVTYTNGLLQWSPVAGAAFYKVLKNGQLLKETQSTSVKVPTDKLSEYQVLAVDTQGIASFASEPIVVANKTLSKTIEIEKYNKESNLNYKNYQGDGFVEISKNTNRIVSIPVDINQSGVYAISFIYSNGNGPVNTENKCAIRTLKVDGHAAGTVIFPQRGKEEWSNWGNTNAVQLKLSKGKHTVSLAFEPQNENMNGEINQAMLDAMTVLKMR